MLFPPGWVRLLASKRHQQVRWTIPGLGIPITWEMAGRGRMRGWVGTDHKDGPSIKLGRGEQETQGSRDMENLEVSLISAHLPACTF